MGKLAQQKKEEEEEEEEENKRGATVLQEELPNHLDNCSLHSQLPPVDCDLKKIFCLHSFFDISVETDFNYIFKKCLSAAYQLSFCFSLILMPVGTGIRCNHPLHLEPNNR